MNRASQLRYGLRFLLGVCALALVHCQSEQKTAPAPSKHSASAKAAPSAAAAVPSMASVPLAPPEPPPPPLRHCVARNQLERSTLATLPESERSLRMANEGDWLYLLAVNEPMARVRLSKVLRSGGPLEIVATHGGLGDVKSVAIAGGAAYFVQAKRLVKLGPEKETTSELVADVNSGVAADKEHAYVVRCGLPGAEDEFLRIPVEGGAAEVIAKFPKATSKRCEYADITADEREFYVADWPGHRILSVSRESGQVRIVAEKFGFPSELTIDAETLAFMSSSGMHRMDRSSLEKKHVLTSHQVFAPFSLLSQQGREYWISDSLPYTTGDILYRMPKSETKPLRFTSYKTHEPVYSKAGSSGLFDFAVDDECVYLAEWRTDQPHRIVAMARPAADPSAP